MKLSCRLDQFELKIEVDDEEMDPEEVEKLFERIWQNRIDEKKEAEAMEAKTLKKESFWD